MVVAHTIQKCLNKILLEFYDFEYIESIEQVIQSTKSRRVFVSIHESIKWRKKDTNSNWAIIVINYSSSTWLGETFSRISVEIKKKE